MRFNFIDETCTQMICSQSDHTMHLEDRVNFHFMPSLNDVLGLRTTLLSHIHNITNKAELVDKHISLLKITLQVLI